MFNWRRCQGKAWAGGRMPATLCLPETAKSAPAGNQPGYAALTPRPAGSRRALCALPACSRSLARAAAAAYRARQGRVASRCGRYADGAAQLPKFRMSRRMGAGRSGRAWACCPLSPQSSRPGIGVARPLVASAAMPSTCSTTSTGVNALATNASFSQAMEGATSLSCSSSMSPMMASTKSPKVTSPSVPPNSSTTRAR